MSQQCYPRDYFYLYGDRPEITTGTSIKSPRCLFKGGRRAIGFRSLVEKLRHVHAYVLFATSSHKLSYFQLSLFDGNSRHFFCKTQALVFGNVYCRIVKMRMIKNTLNLVGEKTAQNLAMLAKISVVKQLDYRNDMSSTKL